MRIPLATRIFSIHLLFTLGAATVAAVLVSRTFERYERRWTQQMKEIAQELPYQPLVNQIAGAYLLRLREPAAEQRGLIQERFSEGLTSLLRAIPGIESLIVVDSEQTIVYSSDPKTIGMAYRNEADRSFLVSETPTRRQLQLAGRTVTEVVWPVYAPLGSGGSEGPRERLGSVLLRHGPQLKLDATNYLVYPVIQPIPLQEHLVTLGIFLAATVAGGIAISLLTTLPVRRLDRALAEFRERGFRGALDPERLGIEVEFTAAVSAINELGGRLEALDRRGREREALLATLAQSLEEGMVTLDASGNPVAWNAAAVRLLGGSSDTDASSSTDQDHRIRDGLRANPELLMEWGAPAGAEPRELDLKPVIGGPVRAQAIRVPFELRPGEAGTLLLLRDLTALRNIETHLLESGRFAVLVHLAAGLAHEIRNPLHSIGVNAVVVEQHITAEPSPARMRAMNESLSTIREETRRLSDLLNDYLGLLRPSSRFSPVDIRVLCRRVMRLLNFAALKSHVHLVLEGEESLPTVHGAADRLQQAILNLVLNAIQAMPQGGEVRLATSYSGGAVRLTVSDNGPGLPEGIEDQIFEPGVTTKTGGSGLGLPLVKMIAEAHGGSVRYRSSPGQGADFTLLLPVEKAA